MKRLLIAAILLLPTASWAARSFTGATDKARRSSYNVNISSVGTVAAWYYPTTAATDGVDHCVWFFRNSTPTRLMYAVKGADSKFYLDWHNNGTSRTTPANSGSYSWAQNQWNIVVFTWDGDSYEARWKDASNEFTVGPTADDLAGRWDTSAASTQFDIANNGVDTGDLDGRVAWLTIWNASLNTDQLIEAMWAGTLPYRFASQSVVDCWPLYGLQSSEPSIYNSGNRILTVTGAVWAPDPRTFFLTRPGK